MKLSHKGDFASHIHPSARFGSLNDRRMQRARYKWRRIVDVIQVIFSRVVSGGNPYTTGIATARLAYQPKPLATAVATVHRCEKTASIIKLVFNGSAASISRGPGVFADAKSFPSMFD